MNLNQYIESLPVVETAALPIGSLFWANNLVYEVVDVSNKARIWRGDDKTAVTLREKSSLASVLPIILKGRELPTIASRTELLHDNKPLSYVFPIERNALDAAYLDVALCKSGASLYVRRHERQPYFEVTNGAIPYRKYWFTRTNQDVKTILPDLKHRLDDTLIPHREGPMYWRLLPTWSDAAYDQDKTVTMNPVTLPTEDEDRPFSADETLPHIRRVDFD